MTQNKYCLLGYASGVAGVDTHAGDAPMIVQQSPFLKSSDYQWTSMVHPLQDKSIIDTVSHVCTALAKDVAELVTKQKTFTVIGGDHTAAIGTWSGVHYALQNDLGLIWIDAHMDSHTPETTLSGRLHGMPLACLLGYGYPALTGILEQTPKIKPENVCLIGVRSFEEGEAALLAKLNVRIYFIEEVKQRGIAEVLQEAITQVSKNTVGYGISLDLDAIDPKNAPGVDVPELNGVNDQALLNALKIVAADPRLIATEIVEFDPSRDMYQKTEKLITELLDIFRNGKNT